jgi:hypothetical protein
MNHLHAEGTAGYLYENQQGFLNESGTPGFPIYGTPATVYNVNGMGPVSHPADPNGPLTFHTGKVGSGDKFQSTLPVAIKVATRTVGFDIVPVIPMNGPVGMMAYMDYLYAGGKKDGCPDKPQLFILNDYDAKLTKTDIGNLYWFVNGDYAVQTQYTGLSYISGDPIFRTGMTYDVSGTTPVSDSNIALHQIFDGAGNTKLHADNSNKPGTAVTGAANIDKKINLVSFQDHIQGFAGAGTEDADS